MRGWIRSGALALMLTTAACAGGNASEESEATGADLSQAEASTAMSFLLAHPEAALRGVGNAVGAIDGAKETWTLYPYQPKTTLANALEAGDDSASMFLVTGSKSNALFLVDLQTGACAGATPAGVDVAASSAQLHKDLLARTATLGNQALRVQGFGSGLFDAAASKLIDVVTSAAAKIAESETLATVKTATASAFSRATSFFTGSAEKTATETATGTAASKAVVEATSSSAAGGAANVGKVVEKVGTAADGKVKVVVAKTESSGSIVLRPKTDGEILAKLTTGKVAATATDGVALVKAQPNTVWYIGAAEGQWGFLSTWKGPANATMVIDGKITAADSKLITDAGHSQLALVATNDVPALAAGTLKLATAGDASLVEVGSEGAAAKIYSASAHYVMPGFKSTILDLSEAEFIRQPVMKMVTAVADRAAADRASLPMVELVGEEVSESLFTKVVTRAVALLRNMGVINTSVETIKGAVTGLVPDAAGTDAGTTSTPTTPSGATTTATTIPTADEVASDGDDSADDTKLAHKAASAGCSSAPGAAGGNVAGLALGLAAILVARRRRAA